MQKLNNKKKISLSGEELKKIIPSQESQKDAKKSQDSIESWLEEENKKDKISSAQGKRDLWREFYSAWQVSIRIFSRALIVFGVIGLLLFEESRSWLKLFSRFGNLLKEFFISVSSVKNLAIKISETRIGATKEVSEKIIEIPFEIFVIVFLLCFMPRIKKITSFFKKSDSVSE